VGGGLDEGWVWGFFWVVCWGMFITPLSLLIGKPSIKNTHEAVLPTHSRFFLVASVGFFPRSSVLGF